MKRLIPLLLCVLLLAGCRSIYPEEYLYLETHEALYAYQGTASAATEPEETEEPPLRPVSYLSYIRVGIQEMLRNDETSARFLLRDYHGETENLPEIVRNDLESYSPKYVYNAELTLETETTDQGLVLNVKVKPGMTGTELKSIPSRLYSSAVPLICDALVEHKSSFMIEITGYVETNFVELLEDYALTHPSEIIEIPQIGVTVMPDSGSVRFVLLQFKYNNNEDTFTREQEIVKSLLDRYQNMYTDLEEPQSFLDTTYKLLVPASGYRNRENATVYSLLLSKEGSSRIMAAVAAYLCGQAGQSCKVVKGEREGELWYWNQIQTETESLYFDLHAAALNDTVPVLMTAEELVGYSWDREKYPEVEAPEPTEPTETEESEATEASTEDAPETP